MALFYKKIQKGKPGDETAPKRWYLILKSIGMTREKEIAKAIADETTLNPKEAEMAVSQLDKVFIRELLASKTVQLGSLGSFHLTLNCEGSDTEAEVTVNKIKQVNVRFTASEEFKEAVNKASFKEFSSL